MKPFTFVRSLWAMTGKGSADTELSEELTDAYFGNQDHWKIPEEKKDRKSRDELLSGAD